MSPAPSAWPRPPSTSTARGPGLASGIGFKIDHTAGTAMIHHGGNGFGFVSDVLRCPGHQVGAVILTNPAGGGTSLRDVFRRRLLELLFAGQPEAEPRLVVVRHPRPRRLGLRVPSRRGA